MVSAGKNVFQFEMVYANLFRVALKSGLYQIVVTFEPYLSEFKVQPKYAAKWQALIKFEE
jgi:hypothetical protein